MAVYKFFPTHSFCEYYGVTSAIKKGYKGPKNRDSATRAKFNQQTDPTRYLLVRNVPFFEKNQEKWIIDCVWRCREHWLEVDLF